MRIIFFNGPPGSGKDTAAEALYLAGMHFRKEQMKQPILDWMEAVFDVDLRMYNEIKDRPCGFSPSLTWRQAMIAYSEAFMKPTFGESIFGRLALDRIMRDPPIVGAAISDCGFMEEAFPLIKQFGRQNCLLVQITRPGHTFDNDSRSYLSAADLGIKLKQVPNHYDLATFREMIVVVTQQWLAGELKSD